MRDIIKWSSVLNLNLSSCLDKRLTKFGINRSQFFYVLRICQEPGITRDSIMESVLRNPSNVTRALVQLEEIGYISRQPNEEDRRTCRLYPTEKAKQASEEINYIVNQTIEEALEPFSGEEAELLSELLIKAGLHAFEMNKRERIKEKAEED